MSSNDEGRQIKSSKELEAHQGRLIEYIQTWRESPYQFCIDCLGVTPTGQQKSALDALTGGLGRVAIKSGHGTGKSTLMSWLGLWGITCWNDIKIPVTAPTLHQLKDILIPEFTKWGNRLLPLWRDALQVTNESVKYAESAGFIALRTGRRENPEALQGFHAEKLIFLIDEASGVDDRVFEVAQGALSTEGAIVVMTGNPTRNSGYFWDAFGKNRDSWDRITFSCLDSPLVSSSYIETMQREYGEDSDIYRVRVLGEFGVRGERQLIDTVLAEQAAGKHLREDMYRFAPVVLGVDVAMFGGDRSVIMLRQGLMSKILFEIRGIEPVDLASQVVRFEEEYKADGVIVDSIGIGQGVISALTQMNKRPISFNSALKATDESCSNMRSQVWRDMRDWLKDGGAIENNSDLVADLTGPEYSYNTSGKLVLERKEDMKKRGVPSPDLADALAMTFGAAVQKRSSMYDIFYSESEMGRILDPRKEWENYNPLGF